MIDYRVTVLLTEINTITAEFWDQVVIIKHHELKCMCTVNSALRLLLFLNICTFKHFILVKLQINTCNKYLQENAILWLVFKEGKFWKSMEISTRLAGLVEGHVLELEILAGNARF